MDHAVEKEYQTPFELIDGKVVMMSPRLVCAMLLLLGRFIGCLPIT